MAHRGEGRRNDAGHESGTSAVARADHAGLGVCEQDRDAVSGAYGEGDAGLGRDETVAHAMEVSVHSVAGTLRTDRHDLAAVHLFELGQPLDAVTWGEVIHEEPVVLGHRRGVVTPGPAQVERVEGRATDPVVPVGEGQLDGAVGKT